MSNPINRNSGLGKIVEAAFEKSAQVTMDRGINQRRDQDGRVMIDPSMSVADFNATGRGAKIPNAGGYNEPGMKPVPPQASGGLMETLRKELAGVVDPVAKEQAFNQYVEPLGLQPDQIEGIKKSLGIQSAPAAAPQVTRIPAAQPAAPAAPAGPQPVI